MEFIKTMDYVISKNKPLYQNLSEFKPDWKSPPGDTIADLMDEKGLQMEDVAIELGLTFHQMDELMVGQRIITPELAHRLTNVLGGNPDFWLERERQYRV